ncbi:unnamed protein product [Closterium sp. Naga37s-1]|nr:unnamed protein product [Closterium sp. Naga37s-1]
MYVHSCLLGSLYPPIPAPIAGLQVPDAHGGLQHGSLGSKCQTPVVACSTGLWCANGGMCVFSEEANATICKCPSTHTGASCQTLVEAQDFEEANAICKCPSTHTGASCQTLVEAQDFGPSEQLRTNFTSPLIIPSNSTLDLIVDERDKYFHTFFALLGALVFVWVVSLCFVYHSRERRRSSRAVAVVGVLEAPPPSRLHKQQQQQKLLQPKKKQQQQNGKVNGSQESEQNKQHLSGRDFGSAEDCELNAESGVMGSLPGGGGVEEGDMAEVLLSRPGEESSSGGIMTSSRRKRAGTGDDVRLLL